jgi:hypothetical protein
MGLDCRMGILQFRWVRRPSITTTGCTYPFRSVSNVFLPAIRTVQNGQLAAGYELHGTAELTDEFN